MAIGARDYIDQMLVKKYAKEKADNPEDASKMAMPADRYWEIQKDVAQVHMAMLKATTTVKNALSGKKAKSARSTA